jgi:hypothetical protein
MEANTSELMSVLDQIAASLPSDAGEDWSAYIDQFRKLLLAYDFSGIEKLLESRGGLASSAAEFDQLRDLFQHEAWAEWHKVLEGSL